MYKITLIVSLIFTQGHTYREIADSMPNESWTGRWFPDRTTERIFVSITNDMRIPMGTPDSICDSGKISLQIDWLDDPIEFTCYEEKTMYYPNKMTRPLYEIQNIPPMYMPPHICLNETLTYDEMIPTFGAHRPLWPEWGEYQYVPPQRWLHSLEHGGLVMLYHPCANRKEVTKLRSLVTGCLYRHIITPYNHLLLTRPLALVGWGKSLQMSVVSERVVTNFIKEAALQGREHTSKDGQYNHKLIKHAEIVTTEDDSILCPNQLRDMA